MPSWMCASLSRISRRRTKRPEDERCDEHRAPDLPRAAADEPGRDDDREDEHAELGQTERLARVHAVAVAHAARAIDEHGVGGHETARIDQRVQAAGS